MRGPVLAVVDPNAIAHQGWGDGWSPIGLIIGLIVLFLIVKLVFRLVAGPRWYGAPWAWGHGHHGWHGGPRDASDAFRRWHDEAHAEKAAAGLVTDPSPGAAAPAAAAPAAAATPVPDATQQPAAPPLWQPYPGQAPQWPPDPRAPHWPPYAGGPTTPPAYDGPPPQWPPYPGQPPTQPRP